MDKAKFDLLASFAGTDKKNAHVVGKFGEYCSSENLVFWSYRCAILVPPLC